MRTRKQKTGKLVAGFCAAAMVLMFAVAVADAIAAAATNAADGAHPADAANPAEQITIFTAKKIVTMERSNPFATAVAVKGDRIVAAGTLDEVNAALDDAESTLDETFTDKIVMPGFIEQHLHPFLALTLAIEVIAPEDWDVPGKTFKAAQGRDVYLERLKLAESQMRGSEQTLFTWGYNQYFHGKVRRPELDAISETRPIVVWHRSVHEMILNTAALEKYGITEESMTEKGQSSEQSDYESGHFYEKGLLLIMGQVMPDLASPARVGKALMQMAQMLHRNGVTAINEPGAIFPAGFWDATQKILSSPGIPFYTYFIADGRAAYDEFGAEGAVANVEEQIDRARSGKVSFFSKQVKLFADGAIISQLMQMIDGYEDGHEGEWIMEPEDLDAASKVFWDAGYQIHVHVNGDLGLEVLLDVLEKRMRESPRPDARTVIVHFANSTDEQIERIARLGAVVSANPYYVTGFANKYSEVGLGERRAQAMVRLGPVEKAGISFSLHSDLPMAPSDPLYLVWCAVTRSTNSGEPVRPDLGVSIDGAMRAITIDAAQSWRKEQELGSIAPGKIANFTILDEDPYEVDPMTLGDIAIWGTVFEGRKFPVD